MARLPRATYALMVSILPATATVRPSGLTANAATCRPGRVMAAVTPT